MSRGYEVDEREEIRALVAGPQDVVKRVAQYVRRKGFLVDTAFSFEDAQEFTSRHNYAVAVLDMGEGDFAETSWLELLESIGMDTRLFCLIPEDLDEELLERLKEDDAVIINKPCEAEDLQEHLQAIVRDSSAGMNAPKLKGSKGLLKMRDYDDY